MALRQETTVEVKLTLDPKLEQQLRVKFQAYQKAYLTAEKANAEVEKLKAELGALRDNESVEKLGVDGFSVTLRCDTYEAFDEKKFIAAGGDLAIYQQALVRKPKKAYEKIQLPKVQS